MSNRVRMTWKDGNWEGQLKRLTSAESKNRKIRELVSFVECSRRSDRNAFYVPLLLI